MKLTDRLLSAYRETSAVLFFKARFLLLVYGVMIVLSIVITVYTAYLNMNNPLQGYAINFRVVGPEIGLTLLLAGCAVLLVRGHFALAAHVTLSALFITIWVAVIIDRTTILARLDTVMLAVAVLSSTPLFVKKSKVVVLIYAGANLAALYIFMLLGGSAMGLPMRSIIEYLADTSMAFIFTGIISYNLFSINARALERMEKAVQDLGRTNEELRSTMEELTATNEEFESQNEDLIRSEEALRESLEEKTALLKEVHHRVKNNMQVISSLLNMQAAAVSEPSANQALRDAMGRIHSMASIHEKIYRAGNLSRVDMASYIDELTRHLAGLHGWSDSDMRITSRLAPVYLSVQLAVPCGLLINELLTNAIKHGRHGSEASSIELVMEQADGRIILVIADRGPGMDRELFESKNKSSMGMQIIEALVRQIGATLELDVSEGTRFTITFTDVDPDA